MECRAEDVSVLAWEDCVKEALQNHPDLMSAREKVNESKADKGSTRSAILPQISSSAGGSTSKTGGEDSSKSYSLGVTGQQLLFDGFKTSNDLAASEQNINASSYNYAVTSSNVRLDLWTAFIGLLEAQESVDVTKGILDRRKQNLDLVKLQYQSGLQHKGSLMTAEANAAQAELDFIEAQRNVELFQRHLTRQLGRSSFTPIQASGELAVGEIDRTKPDYEDLVESTPLLKALVARKEAARYGLKSAKSSFFPKIYANGSAGRNDNTWPPETSSWSAGISVSFPIFQGGQQQSALDKARSTYQQLQADERSGRAGVLTTLADVWTQWQNNVDQVGVQEMFLEASKLRADIVEAQYKSGLATFNDWTIIEDDLVSKQKAILQARTNAMIAEANWLQAKGVTLDE
jgi:outer membrane protein TolC